MTINLLKVILCVFVLFSGTLPIYNDCLSSNDCPPFKIWSRKPFEYYWINQNGFLYYSKYFSERLPYSNLKNLSRINRNNGEVIWSIDGIYRLGHLVGDYYCGPLMVALQSYGKFRDSDIRIAAIEEQTGKILWFYKIEHTWDHYKGLSIFPFENKVLIMWENNTVMLNANDGSVIWKKVDFLDRGVYEIMFYKRNYYILNSGGLFCISPENGDLLWKQEICWYAQAHAAPAHIWRENT